MMPTKMRIAVTTLLTVVSMQALPHGAWAAGELVPAGCIDDNDTGLDVCALSTDGLNDSTAVAVSPDGKSLYAVARDGDHAIVRFNRSPSGALTPAGCIDDNDEVADTCAQSVNGLRFAMDVAVSPDGKSVYVASQGDDAITRFNRDAAGALTPAGCIDDNDTGLDTCGLSINGLDAAQGIAVSPDGTSVYVASFTDDSIVRFNRSSTGALTPAGCIDDNDTATDTCGQSADGLDAVGAISVSADGKSVYTSSVGDNAVARFTRTASGALTPMGCVQDNDTSTETCAQSANGLLTATSVAVSSDGKSVYVASQTDRGIVRFNRSTISGALTPAGCIDDLSGGDVCTQSTFGLGRPRDIVVSEDGRSVYVVSSDDSTIVLFDRATTGALTPLGCIDDNDSGPAPCARAVNALFGAVGVAVSPDDHSVYVASATDDAVVRFNRAT